MTNVTDCGKHSVELHPPLQNAVYKAIGKNPYD